MNAPATTFNAFPVETEEFSADEFLAEYERIKDNIRSVKPVAAQVGSKGFGRVRVTYKTPVFKPSFPVQAFG